MNTNPATHQIFQRLDATTGSIRIIGSASGPVEASFNGGAYAALGNSAGYFDKLLTAQAVGQGALSLRVIGDESASFRTIENVGIGELFIIAGQSNAAGQGSSQQLFSHATLKAGKYRPDQLWADINLIDAAAILPMYNNQIIGGITNSVWPLVANSLAAGQSVPVGFICTAKGATSITEWQPGANHFDRNTLYGNMAYLAREHPGRCVLWWQGEQDALAAMSRAAYNAYLDTLANTLYADTGLKLMPCKLQICTAITDTQTAEIRLAVGDAWADNSNVLTGPDLSGLTSNDGYHIQANANLAAAAALWWSALQAAFSW